MSSVSLPPVALLAGGLATRLRPITKTIPKALVPVCGVPFIHHQLAYLATQGIERVVLCIGYLGEMIEGALMNHDFGLDIVYVHDGDTLLGTGGALKAAKAHLGGHFFILYGDSFLPVSFPAVADAYRQSGKVGIMTILRNRDRWDTSNVIFKHGELLCYDKTKKSPDMEYIDYGLSILAASALDRLPPDEPSDLADLFAALSREKALAAFEVHERFYEIGSHEGLAETEAYLRDSSHGFQHGKGG